MAWTEQMVEDLKKMWDEGLTTGEIGKRLNVSKNSIVGKVHRLQLPARPSPIKKKDSGEDTAEIPAAKTAKAEPAPKEKHKTMLTDLDNHTCRWPIGDPKDENFHFCGRKIKIGQTYCEEHAAVAYVKATGKK